MPPVIRAVVYGNPAPQGSKLPRPIYTQGRFTGRIALVEMSRRVGPWREAVRRAIAAALPQPWEPLTGPVEVRVALIMPKGRTVRRPWPSVAPDLDKLVRSTLDGLTMAGVWAADAQVVRLLCEEVYAGTPGGLDQPGALVEISQITESPQVTVTTAATAAIP